MVKYELLYFPIKGRAESIRLAFALGGIPFVDTRINRENWPGMKSNFDFGTLPVLRIDGVEYSQSIALLNYVGRLSGLYPADPLLALKGDEIIHALLESSYLVSHSIHEQDQEKKMEMRKVLRESTLPRLLGGVNKLIAENHKKFSISDSLTVADLQVLSSYTQLTTGLLDGVPVSIVEGFPEYCRVAKAVLQHEGVKKYYETHK
mmetsp:Transcript_1525/g.2526  ORF Transcript_1525/g.2526 Transcript_1525/m.2526 type:complete len:205 (+) Transcript_1525:47-661(+)